MALSSGLEILSVCILQRERPIPIGGVASIWVIRNRARHDVAKPSCP
jgi:hypothetical protein